jgi:hypothetical protein
LFQLSPEDEQVLTALLAAPQSTSTISVRDQLLLAVSLLLICISLYIYIFFTFQHHVPLEFNWSVKSEVCGNILDIVVTRKSRPCCPLVAGESMESSPILKPHPLHFCYRNSKHKLIKIKTKILNCHVTPMVFSIEGLFYICYEILESSAFLHLGMESLFLTN